MTRRTLILLDVDGVLIHPVGYKVALRDTVDYFAALMGMPEMHVDDNEIAIFEACGITNEWDSGAMCVSAILLAALAQQPDLKQPTLAETFAAVGAAGIMITRPDFITLAREVARIHIDGQLPSALCLARLAEQVDPAHLPHFSTLLSNVYSIDSPVTHVFQTFTLGSKRFATTYHKPALFTCESYLTQYDTPQLSPENRDRLVQWHGDSGNGAAVFTARPSLPPVDLDLADLTNYSPEAELAADLLGLTGLIPLIGQGRVKWLAERHGRYSQDYVKPSPVQALAAIGAAAGSMESAALEAAVSLAEHGEITGPLAALGDHSLHIVVFEDAAGGIRAVRHAVSLMQQAGLDVTFEGVGVSPQPDKRAALSEVADQVVDNINDGLMLLPGFVAAF
jgi:hypothetical protein